MLAEKGEYDAIICLGCVIQGETRHIDFICDAVAAGLTQLTVRYNRPFVFGVIAPNTMNQALDRAGGTHGTKGDETAETDRKRVVEVKRGTVRVDLGGCRKRKK